MITLKVIKTSNYSLFQILNFPFTSLGNENARAVVKINSKMSYKFKLISLLTFGCSIIHQN